MTRGYVTPGEAGLIVFIAGSVIGTALITTLFFAEYCYSKKADVQHIDREHNMCEIRVTVSCGMMSADTGQVYHVQIWML